jgi:hypothetical protein
LLVVGIDWLPAGLSDAELLKKKTELTAERVNAGAS